MKETYTYTARKADNPEQVVTFTLYDDHLSVGMTAPLEQIDRAVEATTEEKEPPEEQDSIQQTLWLKPLAVSLLEKGLHPFQIRDVGVETREDWLRVRIWIQAGGLRLFPITLVEGKVDNPSAAAAFSAEIAERKADLSGVSLLDYWATWIVGSLGLLVFFQIWRRRGQNQRE